MGAGVTAKLIHLFKRRDWASLRAAVARAAPGEAYAAICEIGHRGAMGVDLTPLAGDGSDPVALTIAGGIESVRATRARGLKPADAVTERQWKDHFAHLKRSYDYLWAALAVDPTYGVAVALAFRGAMYAGPETTDEVIAAMEGASNLPAAAYLALMNARTEKWGGSQQAMWMVAANYRGSALPGTAALTARGHFEQWLYHIAFDEAPDAQATALGYFKRAGVRDDLAAASRMALEAETSDAGDRALADAWLGRVLADAGMTTEARKHLKRLGRRADSDVWCIGSTGSAQSALAQARKRARLFFWD